MFYWMHLKWWRGSADLKSAVLSSLNTPTASAHSRVSGLDRADRQSVYREDRLVRIIWFSPSPRFANCLSALPCPWETPKKSSNRPVRRACNSWRGWCVYWGSNQSPIYISGGARDGGYGEGRAPPQRHESSLRGSHMETLFCVCIMSADRPHGSCKRTALKPGLRVEKFENAALVFSCGRRIRHQPAFDLWTPQRLTTTTTTTMGQNILLLCLYAERRRIMDDRLDIFVFLLCSVSSSTVCLRRKLHAHAQSLLLCFEFQAPPIGWNINYSVLSRFQWIRLDANILETMPRKTEEEKIILVCVNMAQDKKTKQKQGKW